MLYSPSANKMFRHPPAKLTSRPCMKVVGSRPATMRPRLVAQSNSGDSEAVPAAMTTETAYSILGVDSNSSGFEQILAAKDKMLARNKGNREKCTEVSCDAMC
jgi:hypothetical protein